MATLRTLTVGPSRPFAMLRAHRKVYATRNFGVTTIPAVRILDPKANLYYDLDAAGLPLVPRTTTLIAAVSDVRADRLTVIRRRAGAWGKGPERMRTGKGPAHGASGKGKRLGRAERAAHGTSGKGQRMGRAERASEKGRRMGQAKRAAIHSLDDNELPFTLTRAHSWVAASATTPRSGR